MLFCDKSFELFMRRGWLARLTRCLLHSATAIGGTEALRDRDERPSHASLVTASAGETDVILDQYSDYAVPQEKLVTTCLTAVCLLLRLLPESSSNTMLRCMMMMLQEPCLMAANNA